MCLRSAAASLTLIIWEIQQAANQNSRLHFEAIAEACMQACKHHLRECFSLNEWKCGSACA